MRFFGREKKGLPGRRLHVHHRRVLGVRLRCDQLAPGFLLTDVAHGREVHDERDGPFIAFQKPAEVPGQEGCILGLALGSPVPLLRPTSGGWSFHPRKQSFIRFQRGHGALPIRPVYRRWPSWVATAGPFITTAGCWSGLHPGMTFNFGDFLSLLLALGIALHVLGVGNSAGGWTRSLDGGPAGLGRFFFLAAALAFEPPPRVAPSTPGRWGFFTSCGPRDVIPSCADRGPEFQPEVHAAIHCSPWRVLRLRHRQMLIGRKC